MNAPLCPALMQGHAASLSSANANPIDCRPLIVEGSACLGSRCAKWVAEVDTGEGPDDPRDIGVYFDPKAAPTGRGWCADNLRRVPFADPARKDGAE